MEIFSVTSETGTLALKIEKNRDSFVEQFSRSREEDYADIYERHKLLHDKLWKDLSKLLGVDHREQCFVGMVDNSILVAPCDTSPGDGEVLDKPMIGRNLLTVVLLITPLSLLLWTLLFHAIYSFF